MRLRFQRVIEPDDQPPVISDLLRAERSELDPDCLGLHLSEAHELLNHGQSAMVTAQVNEFVDNALQCPDCHRHLGCKGHHEVVYRTVFGTLHVDSPRLYQCPDCQGKRTSFSPLAQCLTERTSPELQYLQTKFASLMPHGVTVDILSEVLPLGATLATSSIRRWTQRTAKRLEQQGDGAAPQHAPPLPTQNANPDISPRSPVKAIGIDGGYFRRAGVTSRQEGWFEVMVGKSQREDTTGGCFAYVHRLEPDPSERMRQFLDYEGIQSQQPVTLLSDGGDTVRQAQFGARLHGEWVLDWFHIGMRFQHLVQLAKGLTDSENSQTAETFIKDLLGAKWHLWHGCAFRALERLERLSWDIESYDESESKKKLAAKLDEAFAYFDKNQGFVVNYGDRYRHGDPISTGFVESAVNQIVSKRFVKKQQMAWTDQNAHDLLQIRTAVLNDELRDKFEQWYPSIAANEATTAQAA